MKTPYELMRCTLLPVVLTLAVCLHADQNLAGNVTVTGGASTGNLTVTGAIDSEGNTLTFGTQSSSFGAALLYQDSNTDTLIFNTNRNPASWLWQHTTSIPAMRLDSAHQLILYQADGTTAGLTFSPASNSLKLGSVATLTGDGSGAITTSGAFTVGGSFTSSTGSLTGGVNGLSLNAGGTNQSITLGSSGAGDIIFNTNGIERARITAVGNVGIGTTSPEHKLDVHGGYIVTRDTGGSVRAFMEGSSGVAYFGNLDTGDVSLGNSTNWNALMVKNGGNVGIGTTSPVAKLDVDDGGNGGKVLNVIGGRLGGETATVVTNYPAVNVSGVNYTRNLGFYSWNLPIASGVTDNGYRIGLDIENFVTDPNFLGSLNHQFGLWARVGSYSGGNGTILNSYGVYIENLDGPATVGNKYGLYQDSSSAKNYFAGNVGVGTLNPGQKLHVWGTNGIPATSGSAADGVARFGSSVTNLVLDFGVVGGGGAVAWLQSRNQVSYAENYNLALNPNGGNVGIGTTSPQARLQVGSWNLFKDGTWAPPVAPSSDSAGERVVFYQGGGWKTAMGMDGQNGIWFQVHTPVDQVAYQWFTGVQAGAPIEKMRIMENGNVGIGTTTPTHKLAVNGTIRAKEVIVDTGWADYVFDEDYRLAPLSEVESHIRTEKHLPGIPSAAEVAEHGVSMGDMQARLLSKVEELTLHLIAQGKEIASLRMEVSRLKERPLQ